MGKIDKVNFKKKFHPMSQCVFLFYQLLKCPQTGRTLIGTEAPFAVVIIALGGSAPHLAVAAPGRGAGVVGVSQESEGKEARAPLCVSSHGGHRWWERQQDQRMRPGTAESDEPPRKQHFPSEQLVCDSLWAEKMRKTALARCSHINK